MKLGSQHGENTSESGKLAPALGSLVSPKGSSLSRQEHALPYKGPHLHMAAS